MEEYWKPIIGYEGIYEVSSNGRIRVLDRMVVVHPGFPKTIRKGCILRPGVAKNGYLFVYLTKNGERKKFLVHRLVANSYISNPYNKPCVDHIDSNPKNNTVNNLRWVTHKENQNNPITKKHMSDFSTKKKPVGMFSKDGVLIESFGSGAEAARQMRLRGLNTNESIILQICNKRPIKCRDGKYRLRKTTAGYTWKFIQHLGH